MINNEIFIELIQEEIQHIAELFKVKNDQYKTDDDPLANFTAGALLRYKKADMAKKYEVLKNYVGKHIAHVYNNSLTGNKVAESMQDIIVYFIIARVMARVSEMETVQLFVDNKPVEKTVRCCYICKHYANEKFDKDCNSCITGSCWEPKD